MKDFKLHYCGLSFTSFIQIFYLPAPGLVDTKFELGSRLCLEEYFCVSGKSWRMMGGKWNFLAAPLKTKTTT